LSLFFFQAEDGIRDRNVTGVQTCALPISETAASEGVPQMSIEIDEEKAALYGLNQQQIIGQIQLQFNGQVATRYREAGTEMDVRSEERRVGKECRCRGGMCE